MKKLFTLISLFLLGHSALAQLGSVDPGLLEKLTNPGNSANYYRVRLLIADRVNVDSLGYAFDRQGIHFEHRVRITSRLLQDKAQATQPAWLQKIGWLEQQMPGSLKYVTPYWITNLLVLEAKPDLLLALILQNNGIEALEEDMDQYHVADPVTVESPESPESPGGNEAGLRVVKAPQLWKRDYTGRGRLGMNSDTGVHRIHPALSARWRGNFVPASQAWFGPGTTPTDCDGSSSHGTHTMGTMVGLQLNTFDTIGLAYNAQWIAAGSLCAGSAGTTAAFQWALNPDNDTSTAADVPDVINNSWGGSQGVAQCNSTVVPIFNALEAAGVAVVFSAGNSGPGVSTITSPKNINTNEVNVFCTGNIQGAVSGFPINNSSSRGPSICTNNSPELLIKPEVVAPGTSVRSASGTSGYANLTGTSMAAPHVSGAILLLKEAFPYLPGSALLRAIYYSATDLGPVGEDNTFGNGLMDLEAAYQYLITQGNIPARPNYGRINVRAQSLVAPETIVCSDSISPVISFINLGDSSISQAVIQYRLGTGAFQSFVWNGNLATNQADTISLPKMAMPATQASANFTFRLRLDTALAEVDTFDNQLTRTIFARSLGTPPLFERFTSANLLQTNLIPVNPDGNVGWGVTSTNGRPTGNRSAYMQFFQYPQTAARDYLETGRRTAPISGQFLLRFAVAYAQRTAASQDSLNVYVSTNCGLSWTKVFGKGGSTLATVAPQTSEFTAVNPAHWRNETVNLAAFLGAGDIAIRFEGVNDFGNNLFLDDIELLISQMPPVATFTHSVQGGCNPVQVQFTSNVFNADSLRWVFAPGVTDTAANPTISLNSGNYVVLLYAYNGFGVDSFAMTVNVPNAPVASFNILNSTYPRGNLIGLVNLSQFASQFTWDFGDGTTAIGFSPQKAYSQQGTYTIRLYAGNGSCTDSLVRTDVVTIVQGVSVQEVAMNSFKTFPNPTTGRLQLSWGEVTAQRVKVRNQLGQLLATYELPLGETQTEIDLGAWPQGFYLIQLEGEQFSVLRKVVRQ